MFGGGGNGPDAGLSAGAGKVLEPVLSHAADRRDGTRVSRVCGDVPVQRRHVCVHKRTTIKKAVVSHFVSFLGRTVYAARKRQARAKQ